MKIAAAAAAAALLLAACSSNGDSPPSYKTITCGEYADLAGASDAVSNGSLEIATAYMNATPIDPQGGAADAADFGDEIVSWCAEAIPSRKIIQLRTEVVRSFLESHPADRP